MIASTPDDTLPPRDADWRLAEPASLGFDPGRLSDAARFAAEHEIGWSRDLGRQLASGQFEPPPWNEILGPVSPRGGPAGVVLRHGRPAASWGEDSRADMTFSVAKSYLAVLAGIAWADGLIGDVDEPVGARVRDGGFDDPHNAGITWAHLLQQTSEWQGTLWSKPDQVDHYRELGAGADNSRKGELRPLQAHGRHWEYNDVRVNRLSLSLMRLFRRPLPEVLAERVMQPIGCSDDWAWRGYDNAWEMVEGRSMQGVPGGSHWGGGLWISARDQARLGALILRRGRWGDRQVLPEAWVSRMLTPCVLKPDYGWLWWLNTGHARWPAASERAAAAIGAGGNIILVDPAHDLVLVARWLHEAHTAGLVARLIGAIED
ncbi:MAG TPA: serine hydrolase [Alphaproteobacteria bacterium]|jgi:CubicO group peptidase (beta-lactamase class C family)|nr:serine hydrolase [Alphaproteobacteria bacterium]